MSRYTYKLDPKAINRKYNVSEFVWNSRTEKLEFVHDYTLNGQQVKYWFGFTPRNMIFQRPMWVYVPENITNIIEDDLQLLKHFLDSKKYPVVPFSIETLRYYAPENAALFDQAQIIPNRFKNLI